MTTRGTLPYLVSQLQQERDVTSEHLWSELRGAIDPGLLVSHLAEALRTTELQTIEILEQSGFGDLIAQRALRNSENLFTGPTKDFYISHSRKVESPFPDLFSIEFSPPLEKAIRLPHPVYDATATLLDNIRRSIEQDPFLHLYRGDVSKYHESFLKTDGLRIRDFITSRLHGGHPRYIVNSGIGANEQFNHLVSSLSISGSSLKPKWIIVNSPRELWLLPREATVANTLFMEFSRSGKTEETIKIHEYTPRTATRVVFANSGPLRELGLRDNNLVLDLPDQVSGRFGRNKTPILLAPMLVAGLDTGSYWADIELAIEQFSLSSPDSLPMQIALFIFLHQRGSHRNHIYLGCNDAKLMHSAREFSQFWNEGVNKGGNDLSMSHYFGLLRDSHANIEGILANAQTKLGIFLLRNWSNLLDLPSMTNRDIDPINSLHRGLQFGDAEVVLAEANYRRFAEVMPTMKITVHGKPSLTHAAVLGQLWADVTFYYSKLRHIDPGSNPEVKYVRDRSAELLAQFARQRRLSESSKTSIEE